MSISSKGLVGAERRWVTFWHKPVRAERLAMMRVFLALALLADELLQFLPNMAEFYGPEGIGAAGNFDDRQLRMWRVTYFFFGTDNLSILLPVFWVWVAVTLALLVGWRTRWMSILVWFLTRCFAERNPNIIYGGDSVLSAALFLLMLAPCGEALSVDAWRNRRPGLLEGPALIPPWSLRLIQIQLCLIYLSAGLAKVQGDGWFQGTWWYGTSLHYFLNDTTMARWSYAEFPIPFWLTMPMTYVLASWEVLFSFLVMNRRTRPWCLLFGVMVHLGILATVAIDWFVFYTLAFYAVWIPDWFWQRFDKAVIPPTMAVSAANLGQEVPAV